MVGALKANRLLVMQAAIKVADLGHAAKPRALHHAWTKAIMEEFFQQGDMEREHGLPVSAFMDREKMQDERGICQVRQGDQ